MSRPGIEPVTSRSPERTLYQLSYRGRLENTVSLNVGKTTVTAIFKSLDSEHKNFGYRYGQSVHQDQTGPDQGLHCLPFSCVIFGLLNLSMISTCCSNFSMITTFFDFRSFL